MKHMTIEEAVRTAIEYETKVRNVYAEAAESVSDAVGKRVFGVLANEEKDHLDQLRGLLNLLKEEGEPRQTVLSTVVPPRKAVQEGIQELRARLSDRRPSPDVGGELDLLERALEVEIETGSFYKRMVNELGEQGRRAFARFVEVEEGHRAIVEAEIDHLTGTGYWFDFQEFGQEEG
jgi:rubrerythrin